MKLSLICALATNHTIGINNSLPWHLPEDLKHFKRTTMGCSIIMGRKTWESIGRPLPGRTNIVVSTNADYCADGIKVVHSIQAAIKLATSISFIDGSAEAFVIGGAGLYKAALPLADTLHLTRVHAEVRGDTWFPEFDAEDWREVRRDDFTKNATNPYDYSVCVLNRVSNSSVDGANQ